MTCTRSHGGKTETLQLCSRGPTLNHQEVLLLYSGLNASPSPALSVCLHSSESHTPRPAPAPLLPRALCELLGQGALHPLPMQGIWHKLFSHLGALARAVPAGPQHLGQASRSKDTRHGQRGLPEDEDPRSLPCLT